MGCNERWGGEVPNAANIAQTHVGAPSAGPTLAGDAHELTLTISLTHEV